MAFGVTTIRPVTFGEVFRGTAAERVYKSGTPRRCLPCNGCRTTGDDIFVRSAYDVIPFGPHATWSRSLPTYEHVVPLRLLFVHNVSAFIPLGVYENLLVVVIPASSDCTLHRHFFSLVPYLYIQAVLLFVLLPCFPTFWNEALTLLPVSLHSVLCVYLSRS